MLSVRVEVVLKDGQRLSKQVDFPKGHVQNPLTDDEVEAKFRRLAGTVLSGRQMDLALEQLWHLEQVDDLSKLLGLFVV